MKVRKGGGDPTALAETIMGCVRTCMRGILVDHSVTKQYCCSYDLALGWGVLYSSFLLVNRRIRRELMYGHTYGKSMDQPGKVANPARGQLNRENEYFPVRVRA